MMRLLKFLVGGLLCAATWLASPAFADSAAAPPAGAARAVSGPLWAHEVVKRQTDPAVRFGRLANGMRYAIQHNETPKDGVAMRLLIGAGSMAERDEEQGLAHFLEHMAFRGSRNVPDGEVVRMLARHGLSFGPDTNAFTSHDRTVYMFNFPKADAAALETGFMLFREIGERLTLEPALIEQERGVVLSELRVSDVPPMRALRADLNNTLAGTRFATRWPIGLAETIQAASAERLRRYYQANYRPDNATVVVVGNVDVDAIERDIRQRFSDWKPAGQPDAIDLGQAKPIQPVVEFVADGVADSMSLSWVQAPDRRLPTEEVERDHLLMEMAMMVLNQRLADRTLEPGSPFIGAQANWQASELRLASLTKLGVVAPAAKWPQAMDAVVEVMRRLLAQGVTASDMQRLLPRLRSHFESALASSSTRQNARIADELVRTAQEDLVYTSAQQDWVVVEKLLPAVKPEELTAALRRAFAAHGPVLFRATQAEAAGTEKLARHLAQALERPLVESVATQSAGQSAWPYGEAGSFGMPGTILERQTDADFGATFVRFANGTRLVVKSTAQEKDKVSVAVLLGRGREGMSADGGRASWTLSAFALGGLGKLSISQFQQWQEASGKLLGLRMGVHPQFLELGGQTRPADLKEQLQVLAAFSRDFGYRPEWLEKLKAGGPMLVSQVEANAGAVWGREMNRVVYGNDDRFVSSPTAADIAKLQAPIFPAMLGEALARAADVVIVGDVEVDSAIAAVQSTLAAGPPRPRAERKAPTVQMLKSTEPLQVLHGGKPDQAVLGRLWPLPDGRDRELASVAEIAASIVETRLVETVREKLGITYSPSAFSSMPPDVRGGSYFAAMLETPPDKFETFRTLLNAQLAELAARPVSEDELQRAKAPALERRRKAREQNSFWVYWLSRWLDAPEIKTAVLNGVPNAEKVTPAMVLSFFQQHIQGVQPVEVVSRSK